MEINKFKGIDVGKGPIDLSPYPSAYQLRPIEIYHKEDGAVDDGPSFGILMICPYNIAAPVLGQISLKMFNEGLADVGYKS